MKKVFMLLMLVVMVGMTMFAQEVATTENVGFLAKLGLDGGTLFSIGLTIFATVFTSAYVIVKNKLREAGKLLISIADSIEDKKVDANERKDIPVAVKELFKIPKKTS